MRQRGRGREGMCVRRREGRGEGDRLSAWVHGAWSQVTGVCVCVCVSAGAREHVCVCACVCLCVRLSVCVHMCACARTCAYMHVRVCVCGRARVCIHARTSLTTWFVLRRREHRLLAALRYRLTGRRRCTHGRGGRAGLGTRSDA